MAVIATGLPASLAFLLLVSSCVQADLDYYYATVGSDIGLRNDSFSYAQCQQKPGNCTVSIEQVGTSDVRSCYLELMGRSKWKTLMKLQRFDDNKVVLTWLAYDDLLYEMHVGIINMFDCSLSFHVEYPLTENLQIFPALYRNGFDIFVEKNETMCAGTDSCRVSFDAEGRRIGDPVPFGIKMKLTNVWTVDADSPGKGFFVSGYESMIKPHNSIIVKLVEPTGKVVDLFTEKEVLTKAPKYVPAASNAHEYFGICWQSPSEEFGCRQFDAAGKVRLNISGPILPTEEMLGAHNLAVGGMLVVTEIRTEGNHAFRIRKIDAAGILGKVREVSHQCYSPDPLLWMNIAETEEELIFHFTCFGHKNIGRDLVDVSVLRLPKKNFI